MRLKVFDTSGNAHLHHISEAEARVLRHYLEQQLQPSEALNKTSVDAYKDEDKQALEILNAYPRQAPKKPAIIKIKQAVTRYGFDLVFERTKKYAQVHARRGVQLIHTPMARTFFHQEMFMDDPDVLIPKGFNRVETKL